MGIYLKIAFRNMKRRKSRFILTTITLIIGVALFGGILITNDSFGELFVKDLDNRVGTADLLMRNDDSGDGWFNKTALEGIEDESSKINSIAYRISGFGVFLMSFLLISPSSIIISGLVQLKKEIFLSMCILMLKNQK